MVLCFSLVNNPHKKQGCMNSTWTDSLFLSKTELNEKKINNKTGCNTSKMKNHCVLSTRPDVNDCQIWFYLIYHLTISEEGKTASQGDLIFLKCLIKYYKECMFWQAGITLFGPESHWWDSSPQKIRCLKLCNSFRFLSHLVR